MKHIGKTNENEVIVSLNMEDINTLMMLANGAVCHYAHKKKAAPSDRGWQIMYHEASDWWSNLYDLRETI